MWGERKKRKLQHTKKTPPSCSDNTAQALPKKGHFLKASLIFCVCTIQVHKSDFLFVPPSSSNRKKWNTDVCLFSPIENIFQGKSSVHKTPFPSSSSKHDFFLKQKTYQEEKLCHHSVHTMAAAGEKTEQKKKICISILSAWSFPVSLFNLVPCCGRFYRGVSLSSPFSLGLNDTYQFFQSLLRPTELAARLGGMFEMFRPRSVQGQGFTTKVLFLASLRNTLKTLPKYLQCCFWSLVNFKANFLVVQGERAGKKQQSLLCPIFFPPLDRYRSAKKKLSTIMAVTTGGGGGVRADAQESDLKWRTCTTFTKTNSEHMCV